MRLPVRTKCQWFIIIAGGLFALPFLIGAIFLSVNYFTSPDIVWGQPVTAITGCREMGNIIILKYYAMFCVITSWLLPGWFLGVYALNAKRRYALRITFVALAVVSYLWLNAGVNANFRYRMELRERYGKDQNGYLAVDRLMPDAIREEYARGATSKTCTVVAVWGWSFLPLLFLLLLPFYKIYLWWRRDSLRVSRSTI